MRHRECIINKARYRATSSFIMRQSATSCSILRQLVIAADENNQTKELMQDVEHRLGRRSGAPSGFVQQKPLQS
jgi:hypothetical protein